MKPALFLLTCGASVLCALPADQVKTVAGVLEGTVAPASAVRVFKGVPFAAPPVGDLRWRAPEPVAKWGGVRKADAWGPRCLQGKIFGDMVFREQGMGEDCLYLNIWTPVKVASKPLPATTARPWPGWAWSL
jgi:para-nitrobenzyl esterase